MQISVTGIDETIDHLKAYKKSLKEKQKTLLTRLADIGVKEADVRFRTAQYDGWNDVEVKGPEWIDDNKLAVSATGQAVAFIEFGAGKHYTETHEKAVELGMIRGAYGKGHGKQETWGFYGENPGTNGRKIETPNGTVILTHGNPPARGMYLAGKEMREKLAEIAREVYGSDKH